MDNNPYIPHNENNVKSLLSSDSNNEQDNPYVGGAGSSGSAPSDAPQSMGPRFQALAESSGMAQHARSMAPALSAAMSEVAPTATAAAGAMVAASNAPSFGRFKTYLSKYQGSKKRDFSDAGPPENMDDLSARVAMRESNGEFSAKNPYSSAHGAFQYTHSTWGGHGGFDSADQAPPEMQYNRFVTDMAGAIKRNGGSVPVGILSQFEGEGAAKKLLKDPSKLYSAPGTHNGSETGYKRVRSILGAPTADAWVSDHNSKLANAQNMLQSVHNVNGQQG